MLACGLAFSDVVGKFRDEDKLDDAAARQRAVEHIIAGRDSSSRPVCSPFFARKGRITKYIMASRKADSRVQVQSLRR